MSEKSSNLDRFVELTIKWATFLGMLFLAEYAVSALLEFYRGGNRSTLDIALLLALFIMYSVACALITMVYPTLQSLLDTMFGHGRAPEVDGSTNHKEDELNK